MILEKMRLHSESPEIDVNLFALDVTLHTMVTLD